MNILRTVLLLAAFLFQAGVTMGISAADIERVTPIQLRVDKVEVEVKSSDTEHKNDRGKDGWDKFASISTFLSGIVVALVGIAATAVYNARQFASQTIQKNHELAVQRVQAVEKLLPHLASNDPKLRLGALDAIAALGDEALATRLAERFGGEGGASALAGLSRSTDPSVADSATKALAELFATLRSSVIIFESGEPSRSISTGFFVSSDGLAVVPAFALSQEPFRAKLDYSGPAYSVELVRKDNARDLALVRVRLPNAVAPLSLSKPPVTLGQQVIALGYTPDRPWVSVVGRVTGLAPDKVLSDLQLQPGMAGAPVVNTKSELVGMAIASDPERRTGILIPAATIVDFVQSR